MNTVWRKLVEVLVMLALATSAAIAAPVATTKPRTILVLGDSLSAGYGLATGEAWVDLLALKLRDEKLPWRVVNASISGETTAGGAARIAGEIARQAPNVLVVELGANDGLRGLPMEQARVNLTRIFDAAAANKTKVLLIGMRMPPNYGPEYTQAFEQMYAELARTRADAYVAFLLEPLGADRSQFQDDNLHPVAAAQAKLLAHVWPALAPLLQ